MVSLIRRLNLLFSQGEAIKNLTRKSLRAQYVNSILGISWAIFIPLILMSALSFVFGEVLRLDMEKFPLFILSGLLPFIFFSSCLTQATNSILENAHLIRQFALPKEIIPLSLVLANSLNFLLGLLVLLPIFVFSNFRILSSLYFLPLIIFTYLIFIMGIALFFSSLNVFFRDLSHLLGVILMFLFWITPIFYKKEMLPEDFQWIASFNPLSIYIGLYRKILLEGGIPEVKSILLALFWAFFSFLFGYAFFSKTESSFIKRL